MSRKKKKAPAVDAFVAASNIAIEGKHFDAGQEIKDVSGAELQRAVNARRVVTKADYAARFAPKEPGAEVANQVAAEAADQAAADATEPHDASK